MRENKRLISFFCGFLAVFFLLFCFLPKASSSPEERRGLAKAPALTLRSVLDGSYEKSAETYLSDHFPGRKGWVGFQAYASLVLGQNAANAVVKGKNHSLFSAPLEEPENLIVNAGRFARFARQTKLPASFIAVPTAAAVIPEQLPFLHPVYPDLKYLSLFRQTLEPGMLWLDMTSVLTQAAQTDSVFYKTDHHWTSAGAYAAYQSFCKAMGLTALPRSQFQITRSPDFKGTLYSKSRLWGEPGETLELWEAKNEPAYRVEIQDENKPGIQTASTLFFRQHLDTADQYAAYLDGNHSVVTITNPRVASGNLLVLKDSFAHCLVPFLAAHYHSVTMVDLRYYRKKPVSQLVSKNRITQLLFVYGLETLVHDRNSLFLK